MTTLPTLPTLPRLPRLPTRERPGRSVQVRRLAGAAAAGFALATVAGCSSQEESYCQVLTDTEQELAEIADAAESRDPGYPQDALRVLAEVRVSAPDDLRDEWDTVYFAWDDLVGALEDTGLGPEAFASEDPPEGTPPQALERVRGAADELRSARVRDAAADITAHAQEVCGVGLEL